MSCRECAKTTGPFARGLCPACYARNRNHGTLERWPKTPRQPESPEAIVKRFWSNVPSAEPLDCWTWGGSTNAAGYGLFSIRKKAHRAHRWAYEHLVAPIPEGLQLDHLCRNRACVNPWHLEPVTHLVNNQRGEKANRTHCPHGHAYSPENTYVTSRGDRKCRACAKARDKARQRSRSRLITRKRSKHVQQQRR